MSADIAQNISSLVCSSYLNSNVTVHFVYFYFWFCVKLVTSCTELNLFSHCYLITWCNIIDFVLFVLAKWACLDAGEY